MEEWRRSGGEVEEWIGGNLRSLVVKKELNQFRVVWVWNCLVLVSFRPSNWDPTIRILLARWEYSSSAISHFSAVQQSR